MKFTLVKLKFTVALGICQEKLEEMFTDFDVEVIQTYKTDTEMSMKNHMESGGFIYFSNTRISGFAPNSTRYDLISFTNLSGPQT
jgi:hypothetical protein